MKEYEDGHHNEDYERAKYMEGAAWIAQRNFGECQKLQSKAEDILNTFNLRVKESEGDPVMMDRAQSWLQDELNDAVGEIN